MLRSLLLKEIFREAELILKCYYLNYSARLPPWKKAEGRILSWWKPWEDLGAFTPAGQTPPPKPQVMLLRCQLPSQGSDAASSSPPCRVCFGLELPLCPAGKVSSPRRKGGQGQSCVPPRPPSRVTPRPGPRTARGRRAPRQLPGG